MPTHAYVLHQRAFQESSAIIDCFTEQHGIISLVARGIKRPRSRWHSAIQPFLLLHIDWVGRSDLKTLAQVEPQGLQPALRGPTIRLGLYLNELILRLLQRGDPHATVFETYHHTLKAIGSMNNAHDHESLLRQFELSVLADLGYGLDFNCEPDVLYCFDSDRGIIEADDPQGTQVVSGATLLALRDGHCVSEQQRKEAKQFMRSVLSHYLGDRPLESRKLFMSLGK